MTSFVTRYPLSYLLLPQTQTPLQFRNVVYQHSTIFGQYPTAHTHSSQTRKEMTIQLASSSDLFPRPTVLRSPWRVKGAEFQINAHLIHFSTI